MPRHEPAEYIKNGILWQRPAYDYVVTESLNVGDYVVVRGECIQKASAADKDSDKK